jgi:Homeodomain-like domain
LPATNHGGDHYPIGRWCMPLFRPQMVTLVTLPFMLWELSVTEQRYRAVLEVRARVPVTEVAERYGVSRQSVHAWLRRYRDEDCPA